MTLPADLALADDPADLRALRASELSYRRLFEAARDGVLILDFPTGRIRDVNPYLIQLLGFTHREMVGRTVAELSPFKDIESNHAMLARLQEHGYVRYDDLPLATRTGLRVDVEFVSNVYEAGTERVIQCNIRDITGRKQSEESLRLLSTCVATLQDMVLITAAEPLADPGPSIVFVNPAFERITGYSAAEALGRSPRFLQGPKTDRGVLAEIHQSLARHVPIRRQILNYHKDGSEYWLDIDIVPVFSAAGACTHFAAVERDITRDKKIEEQLLWKTAFFEAQVHSSADAILIVDHHGQKILQNQRMVDLWGIPAEIAREVDDRGQLAWCARQTKEPEKFAEQVAYLYAQPDALSHDEIQLRNGKVLERDSAPVLGKDGTRYGRIWVFRDITERKRIEAQFMRAQRMESLGTLAGGIAHDLNNILAPILMSIELLKANFEQPSARSLLETIEVSARRGADIVRQVLSYARGVDGRRIDVLAPALFADLEKIIRGTFPKDIRVQFTQPTGVWAILGDPTQLQQVLLNLSVNARDAMPHGGSLRIAIANCPADEPFARQHLEGRAGRFVLLSVADSGSGIPAHLLENIFEPFFTTKEVSRGTGLGLSTVMAIVKSHGGIINVYSEPGRGTTFNLYLPAGGAADGAPAGAPAAPPRETRPRGRGETILVVDDEAAILTVTGQTLSAFGYQVLTAADGVAAVALYAQHLGEVALVLTDMTMPLMDGPALVHALCKLNPAVKIVAASGLNANAGRVRLTEGRIRCFLTKPFTAEGLLQTIRSTLDAP
jgi:PAS domain S-box-containing protein